MKTTYSFLKRTCLFLALFCWLTPTNLMAQIPIGTGTVTLNCDNVTFHNGIDEWVNPGGTTTSWINASTPGACCLYVYGGDGTAKAYWDVQITPGIYDVELHYGTYNYGITARFDILLASDDSNVQELYNQPGNWSTPINFYRTIEDLNLASLNGSTTYRVQATNTYGGGGSHFVVEYIKFTRKDGCATPDVATFAKGDAESGSVSNIEICAGSEFSMPNQGTMSYPGYLFTGWKLNNAGALIAAGTSYEMPVGGASFTAQWEVDNESLQIPSACTTLDADNYFDLFGYKNDQSRDIDQDGNPDNHLNIWGGDAQWKVCITPGSYSITTTCCVFSYGLHARVTLIDPVGVESPIVIYDSGNQSGSNNVYKSGTHTDIVDLSGITANKQYIVKAEDFWDGNPRGGCQLMLKDIVFSPLGASHNVTFAKGDEAVTGSLPANTTCAEGGNYTLPGKGDLAWTKHTFTGWSDGSNTHAAGASYPMPNHDVTFTAQWEENTLPTVTNLSLSGDEKTVTLSWSIPGICDLRDPLVPSAQNTGGTTRTYNATEDVVNATGDCPQYGQFGVAFAVPSVENLEWISYECKAITALSSNVNIWAGVYTPATGKMYWQFIDPMNNRPSTDSWKTVGPEYPAQPYWGPAYDGDPIPNPIANAVSQIAIFANAGEGGASNQQFSVRNVRYHVSGREDIDHIVLVRKDGAAPANPTDGDQIYTGTKYSFVDDDAAKVDGHTYYYRVFSVHADGTYAAPEAVYYTLPGAVAPTLTYYERPVAPGEYGTVCIGYAVEHENISGATMFEIDEWSADGKTLTLSELGASEAMVAGRPYIFLASASTLSLGYDGSASEAPAGNHNGLIGSYTQEVIDKDDDNYIIFQNKLYLVDVLAYVGEHRAYIHKTDATPSPAPRRRVTLSVNGTQTTTGIDQLNSHSANGKFIKNGQLFIIRDGRTYNAQGIELK